MTTLQFELMEEAQRTYGPIRPCGGRSWPECFTLCGGMLVFWFNVDGGSTKTLCADARTREILDMNAAGRAQLVHLIA